MRKLITIFLLSVFCLTSITMPYSNFDDTLTVCSLYQQHLQQDDDGDLLDFFGEKILFFGSLFEDQDSQTDNRTIPHSQQPYQIVQIQNGFFHFSIAPLVAAKKLVYCQIDYSLFMETKFQQEYSSSFFHPPSDQLVFA